MSFCKYCAMILFLYPLYYFNLQDKNILLYRYVKFNILHIIHFLNDNIIMFVVFMIQMQLTWI